MIETIGGTASFKSGTGNVVLNAKKDGYTAYGVIGWSISSTWHAPTAINFKFSQQTVDFSVRHVNDGTASGSVPVYVSVLYVRK